MFCRRNSAFASLMFAALFNSHDLEVLSASTLLAEAFDHDTDDDTVDD